MFFTMYKIFAHLLCGVNRKFPIIIYLGFSCFESCDLRFHLIFNIIQTVVSLVKLKTFISFPAFPLTVTTGWSGSSGVKAVRQCSNGLGSVQAKCARLVGCISAARRFHVCYMARSSFALKSGSREYAFHVIRYKYKTRHLPYES